MNLLQKFHPVTAFYIFADIRGFTSWARNNQPEIEKLLQYIYPRAKEIFGPKTKDRYKKRLVKFLGDGFFAVNEYDDKSKNNADFHSKLRDSITSINEFAFYFRSNISNSTLHDRNEIGIGFGVTYGVSKRFRLTGYPFDYIGHKINICAKLCSGAKNLEMIFERDLESAVSNIVKPENPNIELEKGQVDNIDVIRIKCYTVEVWQRLKTQKKIAEIQKQFR